ncbi:MAG: response regulator [Kiritimatiellia bacterium]
MKGKQVLIVDDDPVVCLVIQKVAERHGAGTSVAQNGKQARKALKQAEKFDVIFLDLLMPRVSGWGILDTIEADRETADIPVVIVTGAEISIKEKKKLWKRTAAVVDKETFSLARFEKLLDEILGER